MDECKPLNLGGNQLTSVPATLGGLTALTMLRLGGNQLTAVPAELGRGLHSFTFQLNVSASCGTGGEFRGCLGGV